MRAMAGITSLLLAIAGCAAPQRPWTATTTITRDAPRAVLEPPDGFHGRSRVDVVIVDNPLRHRFSIRVSDADSGSVLQELSLYPADQPGGFVVRVPTTTRRIGLEAHSPGDPLPARLVLRFSTGG